MLQRRDFLKAAMGGVTAGSAAAASEPAQAQNATPKPAPAATPKPAPAVTPKPTSAPAPSATFDPSQLAERAQALAKSPFKAPSASLPDPFSHLSHDQYAAIKNRPQSRIWQSDNVGFAIEPLQRGFLFSSPMVINLVENGTAHRLVYAASDFDFGDLAVPASLPDIGFSGFRVLQSHTAPATEVAVFQGASFFRAIATGQRLGVMARGLSIRTADPRGEEFPIFREVWIEKPNLAANALIIHALLDSQSVTGAYRFTLRPGDMTIVDTECVLFARTPIDHFGVGTMTGAHLLGTLERRSADDVRPRVYDFSGLQMLTGNREWLWRPVSNRETLQVSSFMDKAPVGFGVLQTDRDFERFLDDDRHWELRPSLWVQPIGDWGPGAVTLVEIPSQSEINQNVIAYWRPKAPLRPDVPVRFAYRQFWCWTPPNRPKLARVRLSRSGLVPGTSAGARKLRFLVEFSDEAFADPKLPELKADVTASPGSIVSVRTFRSRELKTLRVVFDLNAAGQTASELRLVLEAAGKPFSETWLYRWTT